MKKITAYYSPDLRALGLMRVAVSLVIIADLLIRLGDVHAFYTDDGIWPRKLIYHSGWKAGYWSIHDLSGDSWWIYCLFGLHLLCSLLLLLGKWTRLMTFLVLALYISLHNRNIFILQAGDDLLRLTLLWGLFLPWGKRYAMDTNKNQNQNTPVMAAIGYYLLIASVYIFTVLLKTGKDWHDDNSAVYYALSLGQLNMPFGQWLYQFPSLMKILTVAVYWIEIFIPVLILLPQKKNLLRLMAFLLILALHAGIGLTLYVGLFYIISIATAIGLLPARIFDAVEKKFRSRQSTEYSADKKKFTLANLFAAVLVIANLTINISTLPSVEYELDNNVAAVTHVLRLDQNWAMFSPDVLRKDGWLVYYGSNSVGQQWDLRLNQDYVVFKEPGNIRAMYRNDRWRKLSENMQDKRFTFLRPLYCNYVFKKWNREHPRKQMALLNLYFMEKEIQPDFQSPKINKILYCVCNEN